MPWCPKCRTEYRGGFATCSDCGSQLVEQLENEQDPMASSEHKWCFLTEIYSENEAGIIESLLKSCGIQVLRRDRGAGAYLRIYMGLSNLGIDLYVPDNRLEEARILIDFQSVEYSQDERGC